MPFYVAPEQIMKDRADYARKGIAKGRSLVAVSCQGGLLICAENPSRTLNKVSEIYDRVAFAAVGKYNEFDALRTSGVRLADVKGYQYSREDVEARFLANAYAQTLGHVFTHEMKPMEVEILVAEVGATEEADQIFHVSYDGTVVDEEGYAVLGGEADAIRDRVKAGFERGLTTGAAVALAVASLAGPERTLRSEELEAALLDRTAPRRTFRRLVGAELEGMLAR